MAFLNKRAFCQVRRLTVLVFVALSAIFIVIINSHTSFKAAKTETDILDINHLKMESYKQKIAVKFKFDQDRKPVQLCQVPKQSLEADFNQFAYHAMPPLECIAFGERDLFNLKDYKLTINQGVLKNRKLDKCLYKSIAWQNDQTYKFSDTLERKPPASLELKIKNEFFHVTCYLKDRQLMDSAELKYQEYDWFDSGGMRRLLQNKDNSVHQAKWHVPSDEKIANVVYQANQRGKSIRDIVSDMKQHNPNVFFNSDGKQNNPNALGISDGKQHNPNAFGISDVKQNNPNAFGISDVNQNNPNAFGISDVKQHNPKAFDISDVKQNNPNAFGISDVKQNNPNAFGISDVRQHNPNAFGISDVKPNNPNAFGISDVKPNNPNAFGISDVKQHNPNAFGISDVKLNTPNMLGNSDVKQNNPNMLGISDVKPNNPNMLGNANRKRDINVAAGEQVQLGTLAARFDVQGPRAVGTMGLPDSPLIRSHAQQVYNIGKERGGDIHQNITPPNQERTPNKQVRNQLDNSLINKQGLFGEVKQHGPWDIADKQRKVKLDFAEVDKRHGQPAVPELNNNIAAVKANQFQTHGKQIFANDGRKPVFDHDDNKQPKLIKSNANLFHIEQNLPQIKKNTEKQSNSLNAIDREVIGGDSVMLNKFSADHESQEDQHNQSTLDELKTRKVSESTANPEYGIPGDVEPDFEQFFAQLVPKDDVIARIQELGGEGENHMNVLVFGMDSMSHLAFQRKMPKTYKYLERMLKAVVLNGYNIVGDATTAAIIPLLTGRTELELPEVRKNQAGSVYVDAYPLIWDQFEQHGYVTLFTEDKPDIATFNLRLNGFEEIPVDHYMRPFYQAILDSDLKSNSQSYCTGNRPSHRYCLDYLKQYFERYPQSINKFAFSFLSDLSHDDNNPAEYLDKDFVKFIEGLQVSGHLNNTVVIMMADHGARYSMVRKTTQGKLEERLPMLALAFPRWFRKRYPDLMKNLEENANRLTTPFDVHATLLSILDLKLLTRPSRKGSLGLSLLREHPLNRTCSDAGVDAHWCTCMSWQNVDPTNSRVMRAAIQLLRKLNEATEKHREICSPLSLKKVIDVKVGLLNEKVLQYVDSMDADQRVANISGVLKSDLFYLQLIVETSPGNALFEGTVTVTKYSTDYKVMPVISRINRYGSQAHCVVNDLPDLRKFCYCKLPPPTSKHSSAEVTRRNHRQKSVS